MRPAGAFPIRRIRIDPSGKTPVEVHHRNNRRARAATGRGLCDSGASRGPLYLTLTNMPQAAASAAPVNTMMGLSQNALP